MSPELPRDIEAEGALLGSLLIDPAMLQQVRPILQPGDFFVIKNGWIYAAICGLADRGIQPDMISLRSELEARGQLSDVGGSAYFMNMVNLVPSALNGVVYAKIVQDRAHRRFLLVCASDLAKAAYMPSAGACHTAVDNLTDTLLRKSTVQAFSTNGKAVEGLKARITEWAANPVGPGEVRGIPTGLRSLDTMLGGLHPSFIICGATTHTGKTALACQLAMNTARVGKRVSYVTGEMSAEQLLSRMATARTGISFIDLERGVNSASLKRYTEALDYISSLPLVIYDRCDTMTDIASVAHDRSNLDMLIIDYLGLFVPRDVDMRALKLGSASRSAIKLSTDIDATVFALHQIGRKTANRGKKSQRPRMTDLQWSGMLEQDADIVMLLYREELNTLLANGKPNPKGRVMEIIIPKNRLTGRIGIAKVYFGQSTEITTLEENAVW